MEYIINIRPALYNKGYRITGQRQQIIRILDKATDHQSAYKIYEELRKMNHRVSIATIYRTLDLLVELNFVRRIDRHKQPSVYELADPGKGPTVKVHLICRKCNQVQDISSSLSVMFNDLVGKAQLYHEFSIEPQAISLRGLCAKCRVESARGN